MILKDEPLTDEARGELIRELEAWEVDEGCGIDCPEEAPRIFVPLVLDSLQHPFVSNLSCNHRETMQNTIDATEKYSNVQVGYRYKRLFNHLN